MEWVTPAEGLGGEGKGTGSPETIAEAATALSLLRRSSLDASKACCSRNTWSCYEKSGGKNSSEAPTVCANSSVALQMCVHSWERPESQMAISVLHTALPASQPALPIMNFLCGISLRPQKLVSVLQFAWGGGLFWGWGGELERPLPSSGQLRMLVLYVSYQAEHNTALSCGVYNWTCCFVSAWFFFSFQEVVLD